MDNLDFVDIVNNMCRVCFSRDKLVTLARSGFENMMILLIGCELLEGANNCRICFRCVHLMKKMTNFRNLCLKNNKMLEEFYKTGRSGKKTFSRRLENMRSEITMQNKLSVSNILCVDLETNANDKPDVDNHNYNISIFTDGSFRNTTLPDAVIMPNLLKSPENTKNQNWKQDEDNCTEEDDDDIKIIIVQDSVEENRTWSDVEKDILNSACSKRQNQEEFVESLLGDYTKEEILGNKIICKFCSMMFTSISYLPSHYKYCKGKPLQRMLHPPQNSYKYLEIDEAALKNTDEDINNDIKNISKASDLTCTRCGKEFSRREYLARHLHTHSQSKPHVCAECGRGFRTSMQLKRHAKSVHVASGAHRDHVCETCGRRFKHGNVLKVHAMSHTDDKPFSCDKCGKGFRQRGNLKSHVAAVHEGLRPFHCSICGHNTVTQECLNKHLRTHTGERPYKCTVCGKCFTDASYLGKHRRIHSGERPYSCKFCNRAFTTSIALKTHVMVHTGERPYACPECPYTSKRNTSLTLHIKTHAKSNKTVINQSHNVN